MKKTCACGREFYALGDPTPNACFWCSNADNPFLGIGIANDDEFRRSWLGPQFASEMQKQGREPDPAMPKDKFEARDRLRTHGRVYIGDDQSSLSAKSRKAIDR